MKRIISMILCLAMVMTMVPARALATEPTEETVVETTAATTAPAETMATETTAPVPTQVPTEPAVSETATETTVPTEETAPQGTTAPTETETLPEETAAEAVTEEAAGYLLDGGICGDNLDWELNSYGDLKIVGSGPMYDYENYDDAPWSSYDYRIETLSLPSGLTIIGGKTLKLAPVVEISPSDATNKKLSWSVAPNDYGIKISTSGVLSTKKVKEPVTVNVMVTTQDGSGLLLTFDITVTPN